jgi:hypothetical protein
MILFVAGAGNASRRFACSHIKVFKPPSLIDERRTRRLSPDALPKAGD